MNEQALGIPKFMMTQQRTTPTGMNPVGMGEQLQYQHVHREQHQPPPPQQPPQQPLPQQQQQFFPSVKQQQQTRDDIHQLLTIILKLRIFVLLTVSYLPYVVKVGNYS
jgi:hypothetical protein